MADELASLITVASLNVDIALSFGNHQPITCDAVNAERISTRWFERL